jgi:hypothetical protein
MHATSSFLVLAGLALPAAGCESHPYEHHSEPPMVSEVRLTPQHDIVRVRATLEPHGAEPSDANPEQWSVSDQLYASFTLRWINLGPDPAPSVVELVGMGPMPKQTLAVIVEPNDDTSIALSSVFDYDGCGTPCTVDLELAWHHAPAGELQVDWSVTASRTGYREQTSSSYAWDYHLTPFEIEVQGHAPVVAVDPAAAPGAPGR